MTTRVGVHEAKTHLSELLRSVESGQEVIVTRGGRPIARLVPAGAPAPRGSAFGMLADEIGDAGAWDDDDSEALGDLFGLPPAS